MSMKTIFNSFRIRLAAIGLGGAALVAGAVFALAQSSPSTVKPANLNVPLQEAAVPRDGLPRGSFAPIVEKVAPAVVKIETTTPISNTGMQAISRFQ